MRTVPLTDGRSHVPLAGVGPNDHHNAPSSVEVNNTTQVISGSGTYNLDIALGSSAFQVARCQLLGYQQPSGTLWRECADIYATRSASEAIGHSFREASFTKTYSATYSKMNGDSWLSHPIFDNHPTGQYILLLDAVLTGSVLRLTFRNPTGVSATLWVKGRALLW